MARLAVLAEQQAARLRASQGQPSAGDEALLEKIPPKTNNAPKFHLRVPSAASMVASLRNRVSSYGHAVMSTAARVPRPASRASRRWMSCR